MKYIVYGHGGSGNHGCEAIVRTTLKMIPEGAQIEVYSSNLGKDRQFNLDKLAAFYQYRGKKDSPIGLYASKGIYKITGNYDSTNRFELRDALKNKGTICLSVGGDNYCNAEPRRHASRNKLFAKNNTTVLWGCSVTPELMKDRFYVEDMKRYSLITARESLTFNALKAAGVDCAVLASDPAFTLEPQQTVLPNLFTSNKVVGINISPLVMKYEQGENILLKNIKNLIEHLIRDTDYGIALIPHVLLKNNNDLTPLKLLFEEYQNTDRVCLVDGDDTLNCQQIKYVISKCSFAVVARTHASIAAYSTCVPTLVLGYSIKSKGIATDIFGTPDNYVLPVDTVTKEDEILQAFQWILDHEENIKQQYSLVMPEYIRKAYIAADSLRKLGEKQ